MEAPPTPTRLIAHSPRKNIRCGYWGRRAEPRGGNAHKLVQATAQTPQIFLTVILVMTISIAA